MCAKLIYDFQIHTHTHSYTLAHTAEQWSKQWQVIYDNALAAKTRRAAIKAKWLRPSQKSHINVKNLTIDASSSASCITSSCPLSQDACSCIMLQLPSPLHTPLFPLLQLLLPAPANHNSNEAPGNVSPCCCLRCVAAKIYAAFACKIYVVCVCMCVYALYVLCVGCAVAFNGVNSAARKTVMKHLNKLLWGFWCTIFNIAAN